nr:helix-turn-helix transcriptional regulator [Adlercreutzia sp. JBNU-10]
MDEELSVPSVDDAAPREERGSWEASCRGFAEHYGLTPRQTEVLLLLTKGYSMGAIEQQLVVSIHTVKAHVYGIYQKADVHSRQELIEKIKAEEDAPAPLAS